MGTKNLSPVQANATRGRRFWPESQGRQRTMLIALVVLAVLLVAFVANLIAPQFGWFGSPAEPAPQPVGSGDAFPGKEKTAENYVAGLTTEQLREYLQSMQQVPELAYKINQEVTFETGTAAGDLGIENPVYSSHPMVVQLFLQSTGELIYSSPGLMPGTQIGSAKLLKNLSAGSYQVTGVFNAYHQESMLWQGKEEVGLLIIVER